MKSALLKKNRKIYTDGVTESYYGRSDMHMIHPSELDRSITATANINDHAERELPQMAN